MTRILALPLLWLAPMALAQSAAVVGAAPDLSNWPHPAAPIANPFPRSTAPAAERAYRDKKVRLGKALFWDEQVSSDNTMACGTCHAPRFGGTDGRTSPQVNGVRGSLGVIAQAVAGPGRIDYVGLNRQTTDKAAPTMVGAYLFRQLFWNMHAGPAFKADGGDTPIEGFLADAALEDLAVAPPLSPVEMGHAQRAWADPLLRDKLGTARPLALVETSTIPPELLPLVQSDKNYHLLFDEVFADDPDPRFRGTQGVTRERFAMAVAHYQRTLVPDQAPIDLGTMTASQRAGMEVMRNRTQDSRDGSPSGGCFVCHSVSGNPTLTTTAPIRLQNPLDNLFSDGSMHPIGAGQPNRKTPTLRNLGLHTKFLSQGLLFTPEQLIDFYHAPRTPNGQFLSQALLFDNLSTTERANVIDFLFNALTDPRVAAELPPFDRPRLRSEVVPFESNEFGVGTPRPGSSLVPQIIANVPPLVPKGSAPQWLKLGVGNLAPGTATMLHFSLSTSTGPGLWLGSPTFVQLGNLANAQGLSTFQAPFPLDASLLGIPLHFQFQTDSLTAPGFSNAATLVPFRF